jgi:Zn-dependent protease
VSAVRAAPPRAPPADPAAPSARLHPVLYHLDEPAALFGIALALVIGVYAHSAAQVLAAQALGDPMGRRAGRLALQPGRHVQVFSVVAMLIAGLGWAEPVPMNERWRSRRRRVAAAVLAGPLAYALLCLAALAGLSTGTRRVSVGGDPDDTVLDVTALGEVLFWTAVTFAGLCVLSLLPVPPLDGGRLLFILGPTTPGWLKARSDLEERNIGLGIVLGVLLLPRLFPGLPDVVGQLQVPLLEGLAGLVGLR